MFLTLQFLFSLIFVFYTPEDNHMVGRITWLLTVRTLILVHMCVFVVAITRIVYI